MNRGRVIVVSATALWCVVLLVNLRAAPQQALDRSLPAVTPASMFAMSTDCVACHNNLVGPRGEELSIGANWQGSMMANSARDPYVLASVRREMLDHPTLAGEIENECATCHAPAAKKAAQSVGAHARLLWQNDEEPATDLEAIARDGVSCTVCHQISSERLGTPDSFNGNFALAAPLANGRRRAFGPVDPNPGRSRIMHSVTGFEQQQAEHIQQSELCATCHTLVTVARGADGSVIGSLPEQMPYQEWRHGAFAAEQRSCQSCHMPKAAGPVRVASVLGEERPSLSRHTFLGGNAFMLRLMNRFRNELGIEATSTQLDAIAQATVRQLEEETATVSIERATISADTLDFDVVVNNLTGHKFPTGYPSRRTWLHVTATDRHGRIVFESGRENPDGRVEGNDADHDAGAFEPHYEQITSGDQVQIYESIMGTPALVPTTGLLQATQYLKDNRLLPRGFNKQTAAAEIAVFGGAAADADFIGGEDRVRYRVKASGATSVQIELKYQPIGYRWAQNLVSYKAAEPQAFVKYYDALASTSSVVTARASSHVRQ
jgi:hypothetical protein